MTGFLGVISAHIRELSEGQSKADSAFNAVAKLTDGVSGSMWLNHGLACAASNTAVGMAHNARAAACAAMASSRGTCRRSSTSLDRGTTGRILKPKLTSARRCIRGGSDRPTGGRRTSMGYD